MRQPLLLLAGALALATTAQAQTGVGIGTTAPDVSAALDIVSSSKGALLPRVADATAIVTPATGLIVFQTGAPAGFYYNAGTPAAPSWQQLATAAGAAITASNGLTKTEQDVRLGGTLSQATDVALNGQNLTLSGAGKLGLGTSTTTAGRLTISPVTAEPKITLYDGSSGLNYYGLGISSYQQNYHVGSNAGNHVFYAGGTNGDGTELLRIRSNGNVGIGTSTPSQRLEVAGSVYANGEGTGFLTDVGANARVGLLKYAGREGGIWRIPGQDFEIGRVSNSSTALTALPGNPTTWTTDIYVGGTGQVGLGTANPHFLLDLGNTAGAAPTDAATKKLAVYDNGGGSDFYGLGVSANFLHLFANTAVGGAPKLSINQGGNVGIGSIYTIANSPSQKLDVDGTARLRGLTTAGVVTTDAQGNLGSSSATTAFGNDFIQNQYATDQVANFRISGSGSLAGTLQLNSADTDKIYLTYLGATGSKIGHGVGWGVLNYAGPGLGGATGFHSWLTTGGPGYQEQMRLTGSGLGIGTSSPGATLDVRGTANVSNTAGSFQLFQFPPAGNTILMGAAPCRAWAATGRSCALRAVGRRAASWTSGRTAAVTSWWKATTRPA